MSDASRRAILVASGAALALWGFRRYLAEKGAPRGLAGSPVPGNVAPPAKGSAVPDPGVLPSTPPPPADAQPGPHGQPLVAFAASPDGRLVATGAEAAPDHADDPVEGVVLWDVERAAPGIQVKVPGGVGLDDQLRGGVTFSHDGGIVAINGHTNGVFTARVATGERLADAYLTENDGPPQHVLSDDGTELFVEDYVEEHLGGVVPATRPVPDGGIAWLPRIRGEILHMVGLDAADLVVVKDGALLRVPRAGGAPREVANLLPGGHAIAVRSGDRLAVAGTGLAVYDLARNAVLARVPDARDVEGVTFAGVGPRALAVVQHRGDPHATAVLVDFGAGGGATLPTDLSRIDWLGFPDALPCALAPDGKEAVLLRDDGTAERWTLDPPTRVATLPRPPGASGVAWPTPTRVVLYGPRVLAFVEMPSGRTLATYGFPARDL